MPHGTALPWWVTGVAYQIYPRSFADSDGDGVGDLRGLVAHLDHVADLGADAVWVSPFFRSPMADFGYDVADFRDVDPLFGTLADADDLISRAHELGLRVVFDLVPNHTSSEHPWFRAARSSPRDPHRDWYVWRDPRPDGSPPNNWRAAFADEPAWTLDPASGQYYLHLFLPEQPDLDWNHPSVPAEIAGVMEFWMARGVDGFRCDVIHCIGKDPELPDAPDDLAGLPACLFDHGPGTMEQIRFLRRVVDGAPGERLLLGETYVFDRERIAGYLGDGDGLHLGFDIPALHAPWDAAAWRAEVASALELYPPRGGQPAWVLSNHDVPRHRTRYGTEARARAAAVLLLTVWGTPTVYAGEELGLEDAEVLPDRVVDPGGRDGCRAPLPWRRAAGHGWPAEPWLPFPPDARARSVEAQRDDPASMLEHYRRLLRLRRATPALHRGDLRLLDAPDGVLAYRRTADGADPVEVWINFTEQEVAGARPVGKWLGGTRVGPPETGSPLGPDEARILSA